MISCAIAGCVDAEDATVQCLATVSLTARSIEPAAFCQMPIEYLTSDVALEHAATVAAIDTSRARTPQGYS